MLRTPRKATTGLIVSLALAAAGLAGCGEGGSGVSDAFGGLSDSDMAQMQRSTKQFTAVLASNLDVVRAFTAEDVEGAQVALDEYMSAVDTAATGLVRVESSELRRALDRYVAAFEDLGDAYQRWIDYWSDPSGPADPALEDRMLASIRAGSRKVQRADRAFLAEMASVLNDDQRDVFEQRVRREMDRQRQALDEAAGQ